MQAKENNLTVIPSTRKTMKSRKDSKDTLVLMLDDDHTTAGGMNIVSD